VLLAEVHADEPGDKAGLLPGDLIQAVDGRTVTDTKALIRQIGRSRAGNTIAISILRKGKRKTLDAVLGKRPEEQALRRASDESRSTSPGPDQSPLLHKLGLSVKVSPGVGVQITAVASASPAMGKLKKGDQILEVNGLRIFAIDTLVKALHRRSKHIVMVIHRDGRRLYVALPRP